MNKYLGCLWNEFEAILDKKEMPYKLLNYEPTKTRFTLSNKLRVVKIEMVDNYLTILITPEQQPYIE